MRYICWKAQAWQFKSRKSSVSLFSMESAICRTLSCVESVPRRMPHYAQHFARQLPRCATSAGLRRLNVFTRCWPHLVAQPAVFLGFQRWRLNCPYRLTIILRSVADIARGQGENIHDVDTQLACIEVFAFGGQSKVEDGAETGYFATRAALANAVSNAAYYIAQKGLVEEGSPAIVRLISKIATRFSGPVLEKFAAQSVPVIGAAGGAAVNLVFINYFQDMDTCKTFEVEKNSAAFADELADLRDKTRELKQLNFVAEEWKELQQEHHRLAMAQAC